MGGGSWRRGGDLRVPCTAAPRTLVELLRDADQAMYAIKRRMKSDPSISFIDTLKDDDAPTQASEAG